MSGRRLGFYIQIIDSVPPLLNDYFTKALITLYNSV